MMNGIKLNPDEIQVIKSSVRFRRESWKGDSHLEARLNDIEGKLVDSIIVELTMRQRAMLIGCIRDYLIYPNEDLFQLSDFEILSSFDEIQERLKKVDIGSRVLNKLKKKKDKSFRLFTDTIQVIEQLLQTDTVYYSETKSGILYKIGILTEAGHGVRIELVDSIAVENFKLEKLSKDEFMNSETPKTIVAKIEDYAKQNKLSEPQKRVAKILQMTFK